MTPAASWPPECLVGPDEITPVPFHVGQMWTWDAEQRWVAMISGTQSGKTSFAPWWLKREIKRLGRGDYLAVTSTFDLYKLKMLPALLKVFCEISCIGKYWGGDRVIEICENAEPGGKFLAQASKDPMWARIILRSADSESGLEAATAKGAWLDEAGQTRFDLAAWNAIRRRLALNQGRGLITTTLYDLGWTKQKLIDPLDGVEPTHYITDERGAEMTLRENDDIALIQFDSIANPSYPVKEFEEAKATMPADEFAMFWKGMAAKLRSLIYDVYEPKIHDVEPFDVPHDWPRFVGIDPMGDKIAAVWLAYDPEKEKLYLYREHVGDFGQTTAQHVKDILELGSGERILAYTGGGPGERQSRADWTGHGLDLQPPTEDPALKMSVWSQIMRVYSTFATKDLFVFSNCGNIKAELGSYQRYKDKSTGNLTDRILNKEMYHCLDSLRAIVTWISDPIEQREIIYLPGVINPHLR